MIHKVVISLEIIWFEINHDVPSLKIQDLGVTVIWLSYLILEFDTHKKINKKEINM